MKTVNGQPRGSLKNRDRGEEAPSSTAQLLSHLTRDAEKPLSSEEVEAFKRASESLENDPDFQRLGALLNDFNLFEALGMVRQELRHSHWLAFLLDPARNHGLGGALLRLLCRHKAVASHLAKALANTQSGVRAQSSPRAQFGSGFVRDWDWNGAMVVRESEELDLLVVDRQLGLAIIIENKIDAAEHGDQLGRYFKRVGERYPGLAVVGLFLTPQGTPPSDKRYLAVSYGWICRAVEELRESLLPRSSPSASNRTQTSRTKATSVPTANTGEITTPVTTLITTPAPAAITTLKPQLRDALSLLLSHYIHLLRRHIVDHPELPTLCNEVYTRHAPILDLLFEQRGDDETRLYRAVQGLVQQGARPRSPHKLVSKSPRKTIYPKFGLREWEAISTQASGGELLERGAIYFKFTLR
ncbi:hypothetical protein EON80_27830, partial [bacterium]